MPRKAINYSKCKFYRLVCKDVTVRECYIGHTTDEVKRRNSHKTRCTNAKNKKYNLVVYKFIRDHGSWDNWQLIVHETLAVENKAAAVLRERYWFEFYKATLNSNVPGRTDAEYNAMYNAAHVDEKKTKAAAYRAAHAVEIKAYSAEKHSCDCGGKYNTSDKSRHLKSQRHCAYITAQAAL
jgi:hypothetical protein